MAQNIYDDNDFFKKYIKIPRQAIGLKAAPEWDSFRSLIPDINGSRVLDLGSGYGWISRWARENGASQVDGIELSSNMLSKAREFPSDPLINYVQADLDTLEALPHVDYGVAVSSLALHYLENLPRLVDLVYEALVPGGSFVFSVEHPIYTSPRTPKFVEDSSGHKKWLLDGYLTEGLRTTTWFADGIRKQHRTTETYIMTLLKAGFTLSAIVEWGPSLEQVEKEPKWAENRESPPFLLLKAIKPAD